MSRFGVFRINGVDYDLDDLTLDEVEQIEELAGGAMNEINYGSGKTMKAIAFTLMRRTSPELEMAEVGKVKMIDFTTPDEKVPATGPPDEEARSQNGSEQDVVGALDSVASITG